MLKIRDTIKEYGFDKARTFFLKYFEDAHSDPEKLKDWLSLFPEHLQAPIADYQREILSLIPTSDRLAFGAPRGSGKSTLVSIPVLAYYALYHISPFSLLVSDTSGQATLHLEGFRQEMESNVMIRYLFGNVRGSTWGAEKCIVKTQYGESLIMAKGAGQKIRGLKFRSARPHLVVIDDLENDEAVESYDRRTKLETWFRYNLMRGLHKEWNKVIYIGTVLHENALLKRILDQQEEIFLGWITRTYKAILEDGSSFWEGRFSIAYLTSIRDDPTHPEYAGSIVFAQEYQNEPRSEGDNIIRRKWIKTYSLDSKFPDAEKREDWLKKCQKFAGIDPAVNTDERKKSSNFAITAFALDKEGHYWHLESEKGKLTIDQQIETALKFYKRWDLDIMGVESVAYQEVLGYLIKKKGAELGIYPRIKKLRTDKDKVRRAVAVSSIWEGGFVHLNTDFDETSHFIEEAVAFPAEPNDVMDSSILAMEAIRKPKARTFKSKPKQFR